jgi:hypothetical protein
MILDKLGEIEDLDLLPKHVFQLVRCGPRRASRAGEPGGSSDPLVCDLIVEGTHQGVDAFSGLDTRRRLEDQAANRRKRTCRGTRGRLGAQPELFSSVLVLPRADPVPPLSSPEWWRRGDSNS